MVRLNKRLDQNLEYYDYPVESRYIDYLRETDNVIEIDNLLIDIPQVIQRKFLCHTKLCVGSKPVKNLLNKSCCSTFEVRVAPEEMERIEPLVPMVAERHPTIAAELKKHDGQWWFYNETDYNKTLEDKANGGCIFLTPPEDGMYKCALHGLALEKGWNPSRCKPAACTMYPLFVLTVDDTLLLTCTCADTKTVIDDSGEYKHFNCLGKNDMAALPMYQEMKGVLIEMFGQKVWTAMDKEAKKRGLV